MKSMVLIDNVIRLCSISWLFYRICLITLISGLLAGHSKAVNDLDTFITEDDYFKDIPIVTSATRIPQPLNELPVSTSIITREMIDASGFVEIADLLRLVPGFQVAHADGWTFSVTSHGQANQFPNNLLVSFVFFNSSPAKQQLSDNEISAFYIYLWLGWLFLWRV